MFRRAKDTVMIQGTISRDVIQIHLNRSFSSKTFLLQVTISIFLNHFNLSEKSPRQVFFYDSSFLNINFQDLI